MLETDSSENKIIRPPLTGIPRGISRVALIYPVATFMPPLGLLTLASILEQMGREVVVLPLYVGTYHSGDPLLSNQLEILTSFNPDLIGIGFMSAERYPAKAILAKLNSLFPRAIFVAGGRHPSCFPQETLHYGVDFVIVGEGETTFSDLLAALEDSPTHFDQVQGLARLDEAGVFRHLPRTKETANLDIIPAYHLIPYQKFIDMRGAVTGRYLKSGWLTTSRGCFSRCIYCRDVNFGGRLRQRSMDAVVADMELQARQYDLDCFYIIDDMFAAHEKRVLEFCTKFKELRRCLGRRLYFAATARTDTLTPAMVEAMATAGCTQLSIGVESGSQRIHDFLRTGKKVRTIIPAFDMIKGTNIDTFINLIVGVPTERQEDIDETRKLLMRIKPTTVGVSFLTAYPGTPLFEMALDKSWISDETMKNDLFQHSCGHAQLDFGVDPTILRSRRKELYRRTIFGTVLSIFKRKEIVALVKDTMRSFLENPWVVSKMLWHLLTGDIKNFTDMYRGLLFHRGGLLDFLERRRLPATSKDL